MALKLRTNGKLETVTPENIEKGFSLVELQTHVGGMIEMIQLASDGDTSFCMYFDEEGLMKDGRLENVNASRIVRSNIGGGVIVGDAILVTIENSGKVNERTF